MSGPFPLLHVVLFEPEKAGNVGNVARTCSVLGAELHLIRPFGFHLHDREFRRAVMDYMEGVRLHEHVSWTAFQEGLPGEARVWAFSTHATKVHTRAGFRRGDYLLFGPESRGLPVWLREGLPTLKLPQPGGGRSLNLAVAAGIATFEAGRQIEGW
ncbi:tRNA (cytidine(34)-2'-O)-methyltransferase [Deinococcus hopiensis]|uniref:Putative tRNA (cytidine(34)-2'-O)-methyltransferase n=1 Tax=Deinococcus hopiensis KR-140 TaxID=695939 RepID=A0A1W1VS77_9DEIO|nr:tRNA (cytidine(34)-2'-O)-methyltransferase [Deinococcus hopiensis]SMB96070.1 tRNA (cytidine/uridine-2'-O-)-methyltransferase [Deinococcus hopiensis KR-140]